jgi:ferredoxin-thioredoxin reductase catalytic subunit
MKLAKQRYAWHRQTAKKRGIAFNFTFNEWYDWWLSNGIDKNTQTKDSSFKKMCMCRYNDQGAYEFGNVYCATQLQNIKDQDYTFCRRRIQTELGVFDSRKKAAEAHNISVYAIDYRCQTHPQYKKL